MTRIKELRIKHNFTQKQLAEKLNVVPNTLSGWENDKFQVDNDHLFKLADIFNVSVDYLLGRKEKIESPSGLTNEEKEMLERFRSLNPERQDRVLEELRDAYAAQRAREQ